MAVNTSILVRLDWAFWVVIALAIGLVAYMVIHKTDDNLDSSVKKVIQGSINPLVTAYSKN